MRGIASRVVAQLSSRRESSAVGLEETINLADVDPVLFSGHLMKRARDSGRNWRKRWFILSKMVVAGGKRATVLLYFKSGTAKKSSGCLVLIAGTTVRTTAVDGTHAIIVAPPQHGLELYLRSADVQPSLEEWATTLREEIAASSAAAASATPRGGPPGVAPPGARCAPAMPPRPKSSARSAKVPMVPKRELAGLGAGVAAVGRGGGSGAAASCLSAAERAHYTLLVEGGALTKFRKGAIKSRWVWCSLNLDRLLYSTIGGVLSDEGHEAVTKGCVPLSDVVRVEERVAWNVKKGTIAAQLDSDLRFEIVCADGRKFQLQAQTLAGKQRWIAALRLWIKRDPSAAAFYRWYCSRPRDSTRAIGAAMPLVRFSRRIGVSDVRPLARRTSDAIASGDLASPCSGAGFLDWLLERNVVATRGEGFDVAQRLIDALVLDAGEAAQYVDSTTHLLRLCVRSAEEEALAPSFREHWNKASKWWKASHNVSMQKVRYRAEGFDLDLTYIEESIIALGFPAEGTSSLYRNPLGDVRRFFKRYHPECFLLYNLCSERFYAPGKFDGRVVRFPFNDHNPCPLNLIAPFCESACEFLDAKPDGTNVIGVHCKAGKGRTGLLIACLLLHRRAHAPRSASGAGQLTKPINFGDVDGAIRAFADRRTRDGEGVTIPSQKRYIAYYAAMLRAQRFLGSAMGGVAGGAGSAASSAASTLSTMPTLCSETWQLRAISFSAVPTSHVIKKGVKGCTPGFEIYVNDRRVFVSTKELRAKRYVATAAGASSAEGASVDGEEQPHTVVEWTRLETFDVRLHGDVRMAFRDCDKVSGDAADAAEDAADAKLGGSRLFHFCFNTAFIGTEVGSATDSTKKTSIAGMAVAAAGDEAITVIPRPPSGVGGGGSAAAAASAAAPTRTLSFRKHELDGARKDRKCKIFQPDFGVELHFRRVAAASPLKPWSVRAKMTAADVVALQRAKAQGLPGTALFPSYDVHDNVGGNEGEGEEGDRASCDEDDDEEAAVALLRTGRAKVTTPFHAPGCEVGLSLFGGDFAPSSGSVVAPGPRRLTAYALLAHVERLRATRFVQRVAARVVPWIEADDTTDDELRAACPQLLCASRVAAVDIFWSRLPLLEGREHSLHRARCRWWLGGGSRNGAKSGGSAAVAEMGVCVEYSDSEGETAASSSSSSLPSSMQALLPGAEAIGALVILTLEAERPDHATEALAAALCEVEQAEDVALIDDAAALGEACRAHPDDTSSSARAGQAKQSGAVHEWRLGSSDCAGCDGTLTAGAIVQHVEDWLVANVVGEAVQARISLSIPASAPRPRPGQSLTVDVGPPVKGLSRRRTTKFRLGDATVAECVTSEAVPEEDAVAFGASLPTAVDM